MACRWLVLGLALPFACHGHDAAQPDGAAAIDAPTDAAGSANPPGTIGRYEAEAMTLVGGATIVGTSDGSDRTIGDLGGEAAGRQAVTLSAPGDAIQLAVRPEHAGANAIVLRYSLPDAGSGGGQAGGLALTTTAPDGTTSTAMLALTSRYAWLYGSGSAGTRLYNTPANAATYDGSDHPTHLYDETQLLLSGPLAAGTTVRLSLAAAPPVTLDFAELEIVAAPLAEPAGFLSITDPACGAIPLDVRGTGRVFDGADDSSYASVFVAAAGINPFNPTSGSGVQTAGTQEKDYYANAPSDALQDGSASAASAGMSMFQLADHNARSLATCLATVAASGGAYTGVWIPAGRFYARGVVAVPSGVALQGAGMWYSKLVAVDTAPPVPVTNPNTGLSGIASVSGDLRLTSGSGGSTGVTLSDFALFGNVTQRDVVDRVIPTGVIGEFTNSTFARLWFEHLSQGIVMNQASSGDTFDAVRSRDTFADGIDFYGETSNSTIRRSSARGNGDDGFAIWSQGSAAPSTGNQLLDSVAELQWFGNGFAVYGGTNATLQRDTAYDSIAGAGLKLSTDFVPTALPASYVMSGISVSNLALYRCGGDEFAQQLGAVLLGPEVESIDGVTLDHVDIVAPSNAAIDIRLLSSIGAVPSPGALDGLVISNAQIIGAPACAEIAAKQTGSAALTGVCACPTDTGSASTCTVDNASPTTFQVSDDSCAQAACTAP